MQFPVTIQHSEAPITVDATVATNLREVIEDGVAYVVDEAMKAGTPISGETAWIIVETLAQAKMLHVRGEIV